MDDECFGAKLSEKILVGFNENVFEYQISENVWNQYPICILGVKYLHDMDGCVIDDDYIFYGSPGNGTVVQHIRNKQHLSLIHI